MDPKVPFDLDNSSFNMRLKIEIEFSIGIGSSRELYNQTKAESRCTK